ncbi:MAG: amino acid ABC transporter substrate-binding protein [candidate division WOR-3 bacterium]
MRDFSNYALARLQVVAIVIIMIIAVAAVSFYFYYSAQVPPAPAKSEIVLGGTFPLSGTYALQGEACKRNWELAVEEWNAKGGVYIKDYGRKLPVKLIIYDDKFDTATLTSLTEHLITVDKVDFLIGCWGSPMYMAQTVIAEKYGFPTITNNNADPIYQRGYRYCFCIVPLRSTASWSFLKMISELPPDKKPKKLAMIYSNDVGGKAGYNGTLQWLKMHPEAGFELVFSEPFDLGQADYTPILEKLRASGAEVALIEVLGGSAITMFRQYGELGLYFKAIYGAYGLGDKPVYEAIGKAAEYKVAGMHWHWAIPTRENQEYLKRYRQKYGEDPRVGFEGAWYSLAKIFLECVEKVGTLQGNYLEKVRDAIANWEGETTVGRIAWKGGQIAQWEAPFPPLVQIQGGKDRLIYPYEWAEAPFIYPHP